MIQDPPTSSVDARNTIHLIEHQIQELLGKLGEGRVDGVAYDTAWAARLTKHYPRPAFESALRWLRHHQSSDGSWGAPLIHYHDRFISTLAAIVTLKDAGKHSRDYRRIKRGEDALWKLVGRLSRDDSDTVGFPILSASLAEDAAALGLDVPRPPIRYGESYRQKVNALLHQQKLNWRASTLTFSFEALRSALNGSKPEQLVEQNHSISASPAATAGYLLVHPDEASADYLERAITLEGTGAVPGFAPIDTLEILWSLDRLRLANAIQPDQPRVRQLLDQLWEKWSPEKGISFSSSFPIPDIDDTAACFILLVWGGYPVNADVFNYYERENHFCCYPEETNPSPSTHLRLLAALRHAMDHPKYEQWEQKILDALRRFDENGSFWWDKWHTSPYYVTNIAIHALQGVADDLARSRLKWILRTQNDDGGWGYLGHSTPEETAYCLETLLYWDRKVERLDAQQIEDAGKYLLARVADQKYPPLWISKGLFTPTHIVAATLWGSALQFLNRG